MRNTKKFYRYYKTKKGTFIKFPFFISYFITDPDLVGYKPTIFRRNLIQILKTHKVDMICFRDKTTPQTLPLIKIFLQIARKFKIKQIYINSHINIAHKYNFDGVHLTSKQFNTISKAKDLKLSTIISCHTTKEIQKAKNSKIDFITYSPIFYKENKGTPKGIDNLAKIVQKYQTNRFGIVALGGIITSNHIQQIQQTYTSGFASIRYFIVK